MRFSSTIFFLIICILSYIFFTIFFYLIDTRENAKQKNFKYQSINRLSNSNSIISDSDDNNFWFVQLTDLHLSKYNDNGRSKDLLRFCSKHLHKIAPALVIVSGDLADSKTRSALNSRQHIDEWRTYRSIIEKSGVQRITEWLDIRGNHDSFNVPNVYHSENLFRQFSVQGKTNLQSYRYVHRTSYGSYSFVGLDTCPDPGLKRPYNFFGILSTSTANLLQYFTQELRKDNMTIWFGHYPTSTIISPGFDLKSLIGESAVAYLCGHLHTLLKTIYKMYTIQPEGFLELELADWRDSRFFRIGVIDHDIFSFIDSYMDDWPIIVVSNPKDSNFIIPHKELTSKIETSTHIRLFVWSFSDAFTVKVFIDDNFIGFAHRVKNNHPLHVLPWNPKKYKNATHLLRIDVQENNKNVKSISHYFNVEGKPNWNFQKWASIILLSDQNLNLRIFYYTLWYTMLLFLVIFKYLSLRESRLFAYQDNPWIVASIRFVTNQHLFYPIVIYLLYSVSGPLLFTELIDGHWGWVFVYGVYVSNTFVPEASPYLSELCQNGTFILPLIFILIRNIRYDRIYISSALKYFMTQWLYIVIVIWQCALIAYWTLIPYGILTTLLSPCRLHVITLSLYMMYFARYTKKLTYEPDSYVKINDHSQTSDECNSMMTTKGNKFLHPDESYANLRVSNL